MVTGEPPPPVTIVVTEAEAGERLDRILAARELGWSRTTVQRWIDEGRVEIGGRVAKSRDKPAAGAAIVVRPAPPPPSTASPEDIPISVLYEDDSLLVLDKPAGLVVHPAPGHRSGTLVNALLFRHGGGIESSEPADALRPGIVHRLDKDTSGVMVVARTATAREGLVAQFSRHDIERRYLAIAVGHPPDRATWETLHGRHPTDRKRFTTKVSRGRRALTHLVVRERLHAAALVECRLETGRTHQIRVHLAEHGFPILGDPVYGRPPRDPRAKAAADELGRQALHAAVLGFEHPITKERLRFEAPPPPDFQRAAQALREV